ncbi:hypothetical protein OESDEN_13659 [Oesophagostomum dentatum]|uniref:Uncharacterized protein n=1 Tax=Oesophagostomum dentatum TaxID=61180 RepID=A0A0B1SNS4_OESDE|nr:hypothetical protein OESDEN_13659 [Oesophagostomum dentatum]
MSAKPAPLRFRDEYDVTHRALDDFVSAFTSSDYFICGEKVQVSRVDPNFISLSVHPVGRDSRRRRIRSKMEVNHPFRHILPSELVELKEDEIEMSEDLDSPDEVCEVHSSLNSVPCISAADFSKDIKPFSPSIELVGTSLLIDVFS